MRRSWRPDRRAALQAASWSIAAALLPAPVAAGSGRAVELFVPRPAGSGADRFAWSVAAALREAGLAGDVALRHAGPGDDAPHAIGRFLADSGRHVDTLLVGDAGIWGALAAARISGAAAEDSRDRAASLAPLARLVVDPVIIAIARGNTAGMTPPASLADVLFAQRFDPDRFAWAASGSIGGPGHLLLIELAVRSSADPRQMRHRLYPDAGAALAAVLRGDRQLLVTGYSGARPILAEGRLTVLAVAAAEPLGGVAAPTLLELGFRNLVVGDWGALFAAPALDPERLGMLEGMARDLLASPAWLRARDDLPPAPLLFGTDLAAFLDGETRRAERLLARLA